ncbi:accessory gene regulator ArgB-like protein [Desulfuribacillus alkaliarsenatis]|uniref:Accessory regulator AgrB n=1 Tax=Desulfuribacillus alkaliarsenatis TaxID=766136 RepID=A0A1E5G547_9FIRM|nr:accessory gene regulator B family protein [Desulfuribacillus alkaliarsenatis]OEF98235.1 hypothetical protein BHF68_00690 [Desulfuribacillus alkaliarsenatis]
MKLIAKSLGNHIAKKSTEPVSANVIAYAIEALLGEAIKIVAFLTIGWLLNCFIEMLLVVFTYIIVRITSGGPHCTSYMRCFAVGLLTFTPLALIATLATVKSLSVLVLISSIVTAYGIYRWVPGEWHERKLRKTKEHYQNATIITVSIIFVLTVSSLLTKDLSLLTLGMAMQLGLLWQFINISPFGYKLIALLDQFIFNITNFQRGGSMHEKP